MRWITGFLDAKRRAFFWVALAVTGVFFVLMSTQQAFRPEGTPSLVDLEIAGDQTRFVEILETWDVNAADRLKILRTNIYLDFGFLVGYSLLLAAVAVNSLPSEPDRAYWLVILALVIALADAVENLGLLRGLNALGGSAIPAGTFAVMAAASHIKWLLLSIVTVSLTFRLAVAFRSGIPIPIVILSAIFLLALASFLGKYLQGLLAVLALNG